MIIGIGTDIVEIARIDKILTQDNADRFIDRILNQCEIELFSEKLAADNDKIITTFLAGRWAVKEAIAKALGCGVGENCSFHDISIYNGENGQPTVKLSGNAVDYCQNLVNDKPLKNCCDGDDGYHGHNHEFQCLISISHEEHYATATAIIETI